MPRDRTGDSAQCLTKVGQWVELERQAAKGAAAAGDLRHDDACRQLERRDRIPIEWERRTRKSNFHENCRDAVQ